MARFQFKPDQKEHHDHAEFGKMHDVLPLLADKAETEGADEDAGQQVAQHGAHSQPFGNRHADQSCCKIYHGLSKHGVGHGVSFLASLVIQSLRNSKFLILSRGGD